MVAGLSESLGNTQPFLLPEPFLDFFLPSLQSFYFLLFGGVKCYSRLIESIDKGEYIRITEAEILTDYRGSSGMT